MNNEKSTITVSQVNRKIALMLKGEKSLSDIRVKGEISNFTNHYKTGHLYFTLKDETSAVRAVMFGRSAADLKFAPENGLKIIARGGIQVFERDGQYQLYVTDMEPEGMGALYLAFIQLKERLEKEGLFSRKRPLPRGLEVRRVAVITAETGAALQDMLNILSRRNPLITVMFIPALVQGANAPASIIKALAEAQTSGADVIIFGRGGGAAEDLQTFNDERLARAVYASEIPTISAVGHETDFTIADFTADLRAPTPSAAAELCVMDISEVYDWLTALKSDLSLGLKKQIAFYSERTAAIGREIAAKSPRARVSVYEQQLNAAETNIKSAIASAFESRELMLTAQADKINALSPLNVLTRGYSIVTAETGAGTAKPITAADSVNAGDMLRIRFLKGTVIAKAEKRLE